MNKDMHMLADVKPGTAREPFAGVHRGTVVGQSDDGVLVRQLGGAAVICCDLLQMGSAVPVVEPGESVVYMVPRETPGRGCLIGAVRSAPVHQAVTPPGVMRADRLVLEGLEEIVLKTRGASIVIRANGDIELLGTRIVSRARGLIKLLAPMLRLN